LTQPWHLTSISIKLVSESNQLPRATRLDCIERKQGAGSPRHDQLSRRKQCQVPVRYRVRYRFYLTNQLLERLHVHGLLVGKGGLYGNVVRMSPPLNISKSDVDTALAALYKGLAEVAAK